MKHISTYRHINGCKEIIIQDDASDFIPKFDYYLVYVDRFETVAYVLAYTTEDSRLYDFPIFTSDEMRNAIADVCKIPVKIIATESNVVNTINSLIAENLKDKHIAEDVYFISAHLAISSKNKTGINDSQKEYIINRIKIIRNCNESC